jgi:predicted  nucleic acid-binding Zn-ribbon protein
MGLFSRVRRVNGSGLAAAPDSADAPLAGIDDAAADGVPPPSTPRAPTRAVAATSSLRDALQQLYAMRPLRDAYAAEAVKLIAKGGGVKAAALLAFDARTSRLTLLASVGIDPPALQVLSGDGGSGGWDIPLRSVRNRRINVIESAHENPFVPPPLIAISPRRLTIATLPFFHANAPAGVVVLLSPTPRGFADGLLKALSQALRVCAMALSELPAAAETGPARSGDDGRGPQPNLLRGLAALKGELARLTDALEESERQRAAEAAERVTAQSFLKAAQERSAQLDTELGALRAAHQRLPEIEAELAALRAQLATATEGAAAAQAAIADLEAARARSSAAAERDAAALAELRAARAALDERLAAADERARQDAADRAVLVERIAVLEQDAAALATAEAELARLRETMATIERERAAHQAELDAARVALGSDGQALADSATRAAARLAALEADQDRMRGELAAAQRAAGDAEAALARQAAEVEALRDTIRTRDAALHDAEVRRADLDRRIAELAREADAAQAARTALETTLAERAAAAERLADERRELLARIDALAAGGQSLEQERHAAVAAGRQRVAELEHEIARLSAALEATRESAAAELARVRQDAGQTLDAARNELADAARARTELQAALAAAQHREAEQAQALAALRTAQAEIAQAAAHSDAARAEREARLDAVTAEHAALQAAHAEAVARLATLEATLGDVRDRELATAAALAAEQAARRDLETAAQDAEAQHQAELAALRGRLAAFDEQQSRLARELEEKALLLQSAEDDLSAAIDLSTDVAEDDSVLAIERDAAPADAAGELDVIAEAEAAAGGDCIVIDAEESAGVARQLADFGHRVSAVAPTAEVPEALKAPGIACAAVNLCAPNAWELVRHLRNGGGVPRMPLVAYALAANAPKGFWLGPVDFASIAGGERELAGLLTRLVPKLKRVIAMSNDIDVMSEVRTQLTAAGISTAVVLDGRQALDLVPTIRPEAAVLHLSPSCADVFRAVAGLRSAEISRDIPIVFLLDTEPQPREDAFIGAGLRMLAGRGTLGADGLVDALATAFEIART